MLQARVEFLEDRYLMSAPGQWLQRGLSGGGVLMSPALSPHNPAEIYLATDMAQMFHSKDLGASWDFYNFNEFITSNKLNEVQFTSDPMTMFALDADNLAFSAPIRSSDAGATWQRAGTAGFQSNWTATEQAWRMYADPDSPGRLIVATTDEIYLSTDGGTTFTSAYTYTGTINASQKKGLHLAGAHFDGPSVYVGTNAGLLISTGGGPFQPLAVGGIPAMEAIFSFAGATGLDANGNTVTRLWAVTVTASSVQTPVDPNFNFATYQNLYSLDVGQGNWSAATVGITATTDLLFVATAPHDISTAYVAGQENLYNVYVGKYDVAAGAWASQFDTKLPVTNVETGYGGPGGHLNFSPAPDGLAVAANDPNRVLVSDGYFAYTSIDGGQSWQQLIVPNGEDHAPGQLISPTDTYHNTGLNNTSVWWINWQDAQNMFVAYDDVKYERSQDGGATWGFDVTGLDKKKENFHIEPHPTSGRIFLSQGRNWPAHDFLGLSDSAINQGGGDIAYSDDGGATWKILFDFGNPVAWTAIDPNDHRTMYASVIDPDPTIGGLYVSHNIDAVDSGGTATFTRLAAQPPGNTGRPHTIEVLNDGTLVLVLTARKFDHDNNPATAEQQPAGSGVFKLAPGAAQWADVTHANMRYWTKDLVVDPHDPTQSTWYVGVNNAIQPVQVVPGYPANQPGLYMTTNRGQSWTRLLSIDADHIAVHPDLPNMAYITSNRDGLYYTDDLRLPDGSINPAPTITPVASFPHVRPNRVFFNPYKHDEVWVATNGGGMLVGNATLPPRTFTFDAASYTVSENAGTATITVSRTGDIANSMSVDYLVSDGTASNGADFSSTTLGTGTTGTLTFQPNQSSVSFTIPILDDLLIEATETAQLLLKNPLGGNVLGTFGSAVLNIQDDEPPPQFSIDDALVTEGDAGTVTATLTVSLSAASQQTITVDVATADLTANHPNDYVAVPLTTLTFLPGSTAQTITVSVNGDTLDESGESFTVALTSAVNATIADGQGLVTITDDDNGGAIEFSAASFVVDENGGSVTITVTRASGSASVVSIQYVTNDGSAAAGSDYSATSGTLDFAAGEQTKSFSIAILDDLLAEGDETVNLTLSSPVGGAVLGSQNSALLTILADFDSPPDTTAPTVAAVDLVTNSRSITAVTFRFSEALLQSTAENLANYGLSRSGRDRQFGTPDDRPLPLAAAVYDPINSTVTLTPASPVGLNQFLQIVANGPGNISDFAGNLLDGDSDGAAGGTHTTVIGHGARLAYQDSNGDLVSLSLSRGGVLELTLSPAGDGLDLKLLGVAPHASLLSGSVRRSRVAGDGQTHLRSISADGPFNNRLPSSFVIG